MDLTGLLQASRHSSQFGIKTNLTKIVSFTKCLLISYSCSTVHVCSKPDWFVGAGTGFCPPGFFGNVGQSGRDAGFTTFHITEDPDGVLCASLIWIDPVFPCIGGTSEIINGLK